MAVTRTAKARPLNGQAETNGPAPSGATPTGAEARQKSNNNSRSERFGAVREADGDGRSNDRYRRLPTGAHGMAREEVARDQRDRLQRAMTELIVARGYQAVRILDLTQLAHVSRPTFYELYADKEELLLSAYDGIAQRTAETVLAAFNRKPKDTLDVRLRSGMHAFGELAAAEPHAMSLFLLGAFGAGSKALARRKETIRALEQAIQASGDPPPVAADLTVKVILGGVREVAVARLHQGKVGELRKIADELITWASMFPPKLPEGLDAVPPGPRKNPEQERDFSSERSRRAQGRLPSGRHDLPREVVANSQRERILDATAEIVAEKGLAALTIPEIASRANVSHETFYEMFKTKMDAFLSAQKAGMQLALGGGVRAWEEHMPDWPRAIDAGVRGVVAYVVSEPAYAHLTIVDAFGASPETVAVRDELLRAFATYFEPGYDYAPKGVKVPAIAAEAAVGGCWQVIHHYVDNDRFEELAEAAPQLTFMLLAPFLGAERAAETALSSPPELAVVLPDREPAVT
jgi:AcrR family transcriptional regulator